MDLLKKTHEICRLYKITPDYKKGQNFLINEEIYDSIVAAAEISGRDVILEIGPGLGFLTAKLAKKAKKVISVELDNKLADILQIGVSSQGVDNIEIINENILDFNPERIFSPYKIVANLPYNITSVFLRKFLTAKHKPEMMVLMLQKEVAERIAASPGKMSVLAVSVQFYARTKFIKIVSSNEFWPSPKVDSAVVRINLKKDSELLPAENQENFEKKFFQLVKFGFSSRRKMLKNNLAAGFRISQQDAAEHIKNAGFSENVRAQELSVEDWIKLLKVLH